MEISSNGFLKDKVYAVLRRLIFFGFFINLEASLEAHEFDKYQSRVLVFLGAPGSGKSTAAQSLEKEGYIRLSISDLLREEIKKENSIFFPYKAQIQTGGGAIPFEVITQYVDHLIKRALRNKNKKKIIIEGFPRSIPQAEFLDKILKFNGLENDYEVIYFSIPYDLLIERMFYRKVCPMCSQIYNLKSKPPKEKGICDICHERLSSKYPMNTIIAHKKAQHFFNWSSEVLAFYSYKNRLRIYLPSCF